MIYPSTADILTIVDATFENQIRPNLTDVDSKSAAATVGHLLRHVKIRIESEGRIIAADVAALRALLPQLQTYIAEHAPGSDALAVVKNALAQTYPAENGWRGAESWAEEARSLREALEAALICLQSLRASHGERADYKAQRSAIRDYIAAQVKSEADLIAPAFLGKGPRR